MNWQSTADTAWQAATDGENVTRRNQWLAALILSKSNAVRRINGVNEDTATKLRAAWAMYAFIRQQEALQARQLRKRYGYRRFYELFALWRLWEFDASACIDHLQSDLSNNAMAMQVRDVHDPRPEWIRKSTGVLKWADVISTSDAPPEVVEAAKVFKAVIKKHTPP